VSGFWRKLPVGLTVATAIVLAILIGLGTWQLARLKWKTALMHDMAAREVSDPMAVEVALKRADAAWQPVLLKHCALNAQNIVAMHSSMGDKIGYRWLGHCATGGQDLLLDLGFSESQTPHFDPLNGDIVGHLRPIEAKGAFAPTNSVEKSDFYWREPALLAQALKAPIRDDYFVVVDLNRSQLKVDTLLQAPMTAPLTNRHLEYALTWYGLALSLLGVYGGMVFKAQKAKPADD
jgi:surfeit locus 1 family protein